MSTSPTSERTVLLWGNQWWLPTGAALPIPALDQAADVLADAWSESVRSLRMIYHPMGFATTAVECPNTNRATLALILGEQFPALAQPDVAWSHDPIMARAERYTTLLHCEASPLLFQLVSRLEAHGFTVNSAWPLAAWLSVLPDDLSASGATTIGLADTERACVYRHALDGTRSAPSWEGPNALDELGIYLQDVLSKDADADVLIVVTDHELVPILNATAGLADKLNIEVISLAEALAKAAIMPARHPAHLLAPSKSVSAQRAIIAASVAFLAAAGWLGGSYARESFAWHTASATTERQKANLRKEVAHLRANAAEISKLRAQLAPAAVGVAASEVLQRLSDMPKEVVFSRLHVGMDGLTATGFLAPGAPHGLVQQINLQSQSASGLWLHTIATVMPDGRLLLRGATKG